MTKKNVDQHNRLRSVTVGFRVSPEEAALIDAQVALSGLPKQEYILKRLLNREVVVVPSSRVYRALRDQMSAVYRELRRIRSGSDISPELETVLQLLAEEFSNLRDEDVSAVELEDQAIWGLTRKKESL